MIVQQQSDALRGRIGVIHRREEGHEVFAPRCFTAQFRDRSRVQIAPG